MPETLVLRNITGANKAQYIQFYRDAIVPVEVRERSDQLRRSWTDLRADLRASTQNQVRVHLTVDGQIVATKDYNTHTSKLDTIWYDFFGSDPDDHVEALRKIWEGRYDSGDARVYFIVERGTSLTPAMLSQVYRENETKTCLFLSLIHI